MAEMSLLKVHVGEKIGSETDKTVRAIRLQSKSDSVRRAGKIG